MRDKYFLDTNILVYTFDHKNVAKKRKSVALVREALISGGGMISFQVVQEFCNVALRKFEKPMTPLQLNGYLEKVLEPLCVAWPTVELYQKAISIQATTRYSFYDALIIAAALQEACTILYSEDLHADHQIDSLKIVNPFQNS